MTVTCGVQVVGGSGTDHLQSLVVEDQESRTRRDIQADAVFVLIGSHPLSEWLGDRIARDQQGFILTGPDLDNDARTNPLALRPPAAP